MGLRNQQIAIAGVVFLFCLSEEEQIRGEVGLNEEDLQQTATFVLGEDSYNNLCDCRSIKPALPDSVSSFL